MTDEPKAQFQRDTLEQDLRIARADLVKARHDLDLIRNSRFWSIRSRLAGLLRPASTPHPAVPIAAAQSNKPTILVIDTHMPQPDRESGGVRLMGLIGIFQALGYAIIFVPEDGHLPEPYTSEMRSLGIMVIAGMSAEPDAADAIEPLLQQVVVAWAGRPGPCRTYFPRLLRHGHIRLVYDTVDLHYVRLKRQAELNAGCTIGSEYTPPLPLLGKEGVVRRSSDSPFPSAQCLGGETGWRAIKELEIAMAGLADRVVVVTDTEKAALRTEGIANVAVIPNIHTCHGEPIPGFDQRSGLLFIGGYRHEPNVDAVLWFCSEILPIIHKTRPNMRATLLGSDPPPAVRRLKSPLVDVPGYVKDVTPYFLKARVFVCPLQFGAGMKGKLGQSLSYGLPAVSTAIGVEGMQMTEGCDILTADTAQAFAGATLRLYADADLWQRVSSGGLAKIESYTPAQLTPVVKTLLDELQAK